MKNAINFIKKLGISLTINLLAIMGTILTIFEFVKMVVIRLIVKLPDIFTTVLTVFSAFYIIYCLFSKDPIFVGKKLFLIIMLFIVVGLIIRLSNILTKLICSFLMSIVGILDTGRIIDFTRDSICELVDRYLSLCDSSFKMIEWICAFPTCYLFSFFNKTFKAVSRILSVAIYPILALSGGCLGCWLFFIDSEPPTLWSFDWWMGIVIIALIIGGGIYLAYIINEITTESVEDSSFGLFTIFEIYSSTLKGNNNYV